jgi:hypothetical protein
MATLTMVDDMTDAMVPTMTDNSSSHRYDSPYRSFKPCRVWSGVVKPNT